MKKFRIKYRAGMSGQPDEEEVEALCFEDNGDWIDFYSSAGGGSPRSQHSVLRIRAHDVERIERVNE